MATLILYKSSKIGPEHNFKIDSIASYLQSKDKITINDFQYTKVSESIEFDKTINASQTYLEPKAINDYDYASITESGRIYYYFITEKKWASTAACKFHFVLDTINTFAIQTDYIITKRTKVNREHKDRFMTIIPSEYLLAEPEDLAPTDVDYVIEFDGGPDLLGWDTISFPNNGTLAVELTNIYDSVLSRDLVEGEDYSIRELNIYLYDLNGNTYVHNGYWFISLDIEWINESIDVGDCEFSFRIYYYTGSRKYYRKIDLMSEGLSPILYKTELGEIKQKIDTSWNLVYKSAKVLSEEDSNPVSCYLIPDETFELQTNTTDRIMDYTDFVDGNYYYFVVNDRDDGLRAVSGNSPITFEISGSEETITASRTGMQIYLKIHRNGTHLEIDVIQSSVINAVTNIHVLSVIRSYTSSNVKVISNINPIRMFSSSTNYTSYGSLFSRLVSNFSITFDNITTAQLYPLSALDRTQSTLIKIIKLPYCPSNYRYDEDTNYFNIDSEWSFDANQLSLQDLSFKFKYTFETNLNNPLKSIVFKSLTPSASDLRDDTNESKLFHSDYFVIKFVYDSFSYPFPIEKMDLEESGFPDKFNVTFVTTSTMNSKFAFMFEDIKYKYATEDYDNVLPISRNNEVVIYNSTYLNYLRTAYRYDLKAKDRTITAASVGMGTSIVGGIAGVAISATSMNPALIVSSIIGATSAITSSIVSNVNTIASTEANIENKKKQYQDQAVSVSGSDDVDIMEAYSNNRAKLVSYSVSPIMKKALADLFYYMGYTTNEMKIPQFNTRVWFNYISMEIDVLDTHSLCETFMNDLKARWANGVTILHKYNNTWDIDQEKENWEVSLL